MTSFSYADWTTVLERFVDERGFVAYGRLARDREPLDRYLAAISTTGPSNQPELFPDRHHELAYYVNAYNALVVEGVLGRGPETKSVWRGLVSGLNFFVLMRVSVDGTTTSLKTLEDQTIRKKYTDARIHAALNCASVGCPPLRREAYDGERLDAQLDDAMRGFATAPEHCRYDPSTGTVTLSAIFDWYEKDFLADEKRRGTMRPTLLDAVNRYRPEDAKLPAGTEIRFAEYDKSINRA